jgi:hypothetical protein
VDRATQHEHRRKRLAQAPPPERSLWAGSSRLAIPPGTARIPNGEKIRCAACWLRDMAAEPKNALVRQYQKLFDKENVH